MPDDRESCAVKSGRRTPESTKGRRHPSVWLSWSSNGQEHGLKKHSVRNHGSIIEIGDRAIRPKPDSIKMRQARRFVKRAGRC